ncbi:MAG: proline--tRNA ligase [Candidatus Scalindua sp.]|nr:proline--tRNA ligase [Candidatus Scalindua sp.]
MKWTQTLIPTLKEDPSDAEVESHKLMVRSGMIRRLSAGVYSYLPLGIRVLNKVNTIIREEMNSAGSVEILLPALQSLSLFELSGRISAFGNDLLCMKDRHGKEVALSPTHEEVITDLIKNELGSYKNMPLILYQIQTKFRDEARPRFGVLRSREFLMKDAYSFDVDTDGLNVSYQKMYDTYCRILNRCQLDYLIVEADTGVMGGDVSHEFMVPNSNGEDVIVKCSCCDYAANLEKAVAAQTETEEESILEELKEVSTPKMSTIKDVSNFLGIEPKKMVKTLIYSYNNTHVAVLVRGDHDVNETKLAKLLSQDKIELADEKTVVSLTNSPVGFAGPIGLKTHIIADRAVSTMKNCVVGGNKADTHIINANMERDFTVNKIADIRFVGKDDKCPKCKELLTISRGIEIGHVFKLGTKYSKTLGAKFLDKTGKENPIVMGSYGIGINRIIAATIERSHDKDGIIWPIPLAPYEVLVVPVNINDNTFLDTATKIYDQLCKDGVEVLLDDRDHRPGFKFKDADLIGIPIRITVGKGYKEKGELEIKVRSNNKIYFSTPENLVREIKTIITSLHAK